MSNYQREADPAITSDGSHFLMSESSQQWHHRSESFNTPQGYTIFSRRLELSLRAAVGVPTHGREGLRSVVSDLAGSLDNFASVRRKIRADLSDNLRHAEIADCGAGTGSMLGFIEWAGLPYPQRLVLVEPNTPYVDYIKQRIEFGNQVGRSSLTVLSKKNLTEDPQNVVYEVEDTRNKQQSEIQVINSRIEEAPASIAPDAVFTFIGVSKYFSPAEFKTLVAAARLNLASGSNTVVFNAQGEGDLIPEVSTVEGGIYKMAKRLHQMKTRGRSNLHNFYSRDDLEFFQEPYTIIHNGGGQIVIKLPGSH